jgi:flagellar motor protein MotB
MLRSRAVASAALGLAALILAACHSPPPPAPEPMPPPPPPPIAGPTVSEQNLATLAADETFAPGSWTLTRRGHAKLNALVPQLKGMANARVVVYGYTDNAPVGAALKKRGVEDNLDLSSKRADAVVRYLAQHGIDPAIMSAKGRGDTHPIAPNDTPQGRHQNRRIEVVVEQPT